MRASHRGAALRSAAAMARPRCRAPCWASRSRAPALAQGVVKAKHGDWEMRCETPPGAAAEQCALIQSVAAEDRPNVNLVVIVLQDGRRQEPAAARHRAARRAASLGPRPQDRPDRRRPRRLRALPADRLHRRSRDGGQADRSDEERADGDLHHLPDARRGHRHPAGARRLQGSASKSCLEGAWGLDRRASGRGGKSDIHDRALARAELRGMAAKVYSSFMPALVRHAASPASAPPAIRWGSEARSGQYDFRRRWDSTPVANPSAVALARRKRRSIARRSRCRTERPSCASAATPIIGPLPVLHRQYRARMPRPGQSVQRSRSASPAICLIGPAGSPGAYSAHCESSCATMRTRSRSSRRPTRWRPTPPAAARARFNIVTDPIVLPFTHQQADRGLHDPRRLRRRAPSRRSAEIPPQETSERGRPELTKPPASGLLAGVRQRPPAEETGGAL